MEGWEEGWEEVYEKQYISAVKRKGSTITEYLGSRKRGKKMVQSSSRRSEIVLHLQSGFALPYQSRSYRGYPRNDREYCVRSFYRTTHITDVTQPNRTE